DWQSSADERLWVTQALRREAEALILPDVPPLRRPGTAPGPEDERLALVELCHARGLHRTAARLMADAFAADPKRAHESTSAARARQMFALWQADPDLAPVREPDAIKKFSPDEREKWESLWNDVRRAVGK